MGIFANTDRAFEPFLDERVLVEGVRGDRCAKVVCAACVIDAGFADVDADAVSSSGEHAFSVRIRVMDWTEVDPPRRGDDMTLESGVRMRVTSCLRDGAWFVMSAKTKGCAS